MSFSVYRKPTHKRRQDAQGKRVAIPFIPGLSQRVARCLRKVGLEVSMKPPPTLKSVLCKKKPQQTSKFGLVYVIPCSDCPWSYVGETGRSLEERLKEHKRAVRSFVASSEVANHVIQTGHAMKWSGAECLTRESCYFRRIFKEAWHTRARGSGNRVFHNLYPALNSLV